MMDRRAFITVVGASIVALPLVAKGQQAGKVPRIGVLVPVEPESPTEPNIAAFRQEMRSLGYVEGQNIAIEYRYAHGKKELYPELASDLVRLKVDVIVVGAGDPTRAAKNATQTIPIVGVGMGSDPIASGIVASLARPGGNVTGSSFTTGLEFQGKYVDLLKEVAPRTVRVLYLRDPRQPAQFSRKFSDAVEAAAHSLGLSFQIVEAPELHEVDSMLAKMSRMRGSSLIVEASLFFQVHASDITKMAAKHGLPAIYATRLFFMDAGGLMSYGPSLVALWRAAAISVDKILKGAKPADLPVEQPTKFELVINMKTAKALGLTIPQTLLLRTDQVIQ